MDDFLSINLDFEVFLFERGYFGYFDVPPDIQSLVYNYFHDLDHAELAYQLSKDKNDKEGVEFWQAEINRISEVINNLLSNYYCIA